MSWFAVALALLGASAVLSIPAGRRSPGWGYLASLAMVGSMTLAGILYFSLSSPRPIVGIAILVVATATLVGATITWTATKDGRHPDPRQRGHLDEIASPAGRD